MPLFELYCLIERYLRFRNWICFLLVSISGLSEVGILKLCTCSFKIKIVLFLLHMGLCFCRYWACRYTISKVQRIHEVIEFITLWLLVALCLINLFSLWSSFNVVRFLLNELKSKFGWLFDCLAAFALQKIMESWWYVGRNWCCDPPEDEQIILIIQHLPSYLMVQS